MLMVIICMAIAIGVLAGVVIRDEKIHQRKFDDWYNGYPRRQKRAYKVPLKVVFDVHVPRGPKHRYINP